MKTIKKPTTPKKVFVGGGAFLCILPIEFFLCILPIEFLDLFFYDNLVNTSNALYAIKR